VLGSAIQQREVGLVTEQDQQLLERLADAGKATTLLADDFAIAKLLEADGMIFIIHDSADAIITPKGRNLLAANDLGKRRKAPICFTS
jgi:hypothetical protein